MTKAWYDSGPHFVELLPSAARTAAGQGALVRLPLMPAAMRLQLVVTAVSGTTPTMTATVQDSVDGTNWTNLAPAFAAKTTAVQETISITTATVSPLVRVSWTMGGTTPSFTFYVVGYVR